MGTIVLAGGGVAGIAWELGVLAGLTEADPELGARLRAPEVALVGTSAGSVVAAQFASDVPLGELCAAQESPHTAEIDPGVSLTALRRRWETTVAGHTDPVEIRRRIGRLALAADTVSTAERMVAIRARLPESHWPRRPLAVTAVDIVTGELRVFDADPGVPLADAVAASCAVPGVWPVVRIGGKSYMDGGVRSAGNVDLAAGADWVLVIAPLELDAADGFLALPPSELDTLGRHEVVSADAASVLAFGDDPLDPARRPGSLRAGRTVGAAAALRVRHLLDG